MTKAPSLSFVIPAYNEEKHIGDVTRRTRQHLDHVLVVDIVDRLRLMVFPLILGGTGKEPIYVDYPQVPLELVGTKVLDSRLVLLEYHPAASAN